MLSNAPTVVERGLSPRSRARRLRRLTVRPAKATHRLASSSRSIADGVESEPENPVDQLRIGEVSLEGGLGEILVFSQDGIGVGFDEIDLVVGREPQIET